MKHILPLLLMGGIVLGVVFFIDDEYDEHDEPLNADIMYEDSSNDWIVTFFVKDLRKKTPELGVQLEYQSNDMSAESVKDLELYIESNYGPLFFQSLDLENFEGVTTFTETCDPCVESNEEQHEVTVSIFWRNEEGETRFDHLYLTPLND